MRKMKIFRPRLNEKLEDRTVPSTLGHGGIVAHVSLGSGGTTTTPTISPISLGGGLGSLLQGGGGCSGGGLGASSLGSSSSALGTAARDVSSAIQTFDTTVVVPAEHTLQLALAGTPTAAQISAAQSAFVTTITNAITGTSGLNSTINTALAKDLPNTYSTVETAITGASGLTSTLLTDLTAAASGISSSSNSAYLALNREVQGDIRSIANQATQDIRADAPTGLVTSSSLQTFNQAVRTAYSAFNTAISGAEQTSITSGTALSSSAVSTAVTNLQTALTAAVGTLPAAFQSSASNTTAAAISGLSSLTTTLEAVTAPTVGSNSSARLFLRAVSSDIATALSPVNLAINTSIQNYNNGLY